MHGQFVWYELMTTDSAAAKKFYPAVTGWGVTKWDDPGLDYSMWTAGGEPIGGVIDLTPEQRSQGIPPNWLPYVAVDSVDGTSSKATALGAKVVVAPFDIPGVGRMAVITDPQGASLALYRSSGDAYLFDGTAKLGHMSWHELTTTDHKAALTFYSALFGWQKIQEMDMGGGAMYVIFGHGSKQYGGMFNSNPAWGNMPPNWLPYINVRDIKAAESAIKRGGARIMNGPMEVPDGSWIITGTDLQGAVFAVHAVSAKAAARAKANVGQKSRPAARKAKAKAKPKKKKARAKPARKAAKKKGKKKNKKKR